MTSSSVLNEIHFQVLRYFESRSGLTERDIARDLRASLAKPSYCFRVLIEKGVVKMGNFIHNQGSLHYAHLLTPGGIKSRVVLTHTFLSARLPNAQYTSARYIRQRGMMEIKELVNQYKRINTTLSELGVGECSKPIQGFSEYK